MKVWFRESNKLFELLKKYLLLNYDEISHYFSWLLSCCIITFWCDPDDESRAGLQDGRF
jgi:hypothetical protein